MSIRCLFYRFGIASALLALGVGCVRLPTVLQPEATDQRRNRLEQLTYPIGLTASGKAPLKNGYYEEPAAPDAAATTWVRLGRPNAWGDLTGDGREDAVALLIASSGGTGVFYYLAPVLQDTDGEWTPVGTKFLGDRIRVESILIRDGMLVVDYFDRRPGQPMTTRPTHQRQLRFRLKNGTLQPVLTK